LASSVEQNSAGRVRTRSSLAGCSSISAVPNEAEWNGRSHSPPKQASLIECSQLSKVSHPTKQNLTALRGNRVAFLFAYRVCVSCIVKCLNGGRAGLFLILIIPRTKWSLPTRHSTKHYEIGEMLMGKMEYFSFRVSR